MPRRSLEQDLRATRLRALPVLVVLNVLVYLAWHVLAGLGPLGMAFMETNFLVSAEHLSHGLFWTVLTSAFSHIDTMHLFFNMYALWLFGADVERVVGWRGFVHLYVAGGVVASLGHALYDTMAGSGAPALGASGAVMAVAVTAALIWPRRPLLLFFVLPISQLSAVGLFVLLDLFGAISPAEDGIAHAAHLGGAVYGWLYVRRHANGYLAARLRELRDARRGPPRPPRGGRGGGPWTHPPA